MLLIAKGENQCLCFGNIVEEEMYSKHTLIEYSWKENSPQKQMHQTKGVYITPGNQTIMQSSFESIPYQQGTIHHPTLPPMTLHSWSILWSSTSKKA